MKRKIFLFNVTLLIYIANLTISDGQVPADNLPDGVLARFSPGASVYTVAFSPDGKFLASGGDDNAVILWNVVDENEREAFIEHSKAVTSVAFSPDGKLLASASLDGYVRLWHVSSEGRRISLRHGDSVESVAFSSDGKTLVSGGGDQEGSVILWDVPQKRDIATFSGHGSIVESVVFSPDGQILASASRDNTIKLWDVEGQRMCKTLFGHSSVVHAVVFSPDGETLASSSRDNTIKLWQVSSGENLTTFEIQNSLYVYAESIAFSPDGQLLAAACVDYTVKLWDVVNHREAATLTGHHGGVTSVAFSPDGKTLASGSRDRTILLWNLFHFGFKMPPIADTSEVSDFPAVDEPENPRIDPLSEEPEPSVPESESLPHRQDTTPPDIVIQSPIERIVNSTVRQISVSVNVADDSGVAEVWVNDREASVLEADVFSVTVPLNNGENVIRIIATDAHGNMGTHRFTIVREEPEHIDPIPPNIVMLSPRESIVSLTDKQFIVQGNVTDNNSVNEVRVNNTGVEVSEDGVFTATVQLTYGENPIRVTATDISGNMDTNQFTIVRNENPPPPPSDDDIGPDIRILHPVANVTRGVQARIHSLEMFTRISGIVTDPNGIAEVTVNGTEVQVTGDGFTTTVQLVHGNNPIRVTATDTWENRSVKVITIFYNDDEPENSDDNYVRQGTDYALLFAVEDYDHWGKLRNPIFDAVAIQQDLQDIYGFQVELISNPTQESIIGALRKYAEKEYTSEDQLLIFFAGHGYFDTTFEVGYFVVKETQKPENDEARMSYFTHSEFRDIIDRMSCKHIFLVLDTCYSGTFDPRNVPRGEAEEGSERLSPTDIKRNFTYTTRWYLTSGNEIVSDGEPGQHSPFVRELLGALRSKGGRDNILTIGDISKKLKNLKDPEPCSDEFGINQPKSDFLFIAR